MITICMQSVSQITLVEFRLTTHFMVRAFQQLHISNKKESYASVHTKYVGHREVKDQVPALPTICTFTEILYISLRYWSIYKVILKPKLNFYALACVLCPFEFLIILFIIYIHKIN